MPDSTQGGIYDSTAEWDRVIHGHGALDSLDAEAERLGVSKVLIATNRSLAEGGDTSLLDTVREVLGSRVVGVFSGCRQHVPRNTALACAAAITSDGCDGIVSLGGGSVVDTAKAAALVLRANVATEEAFDRYKLRSRAAGTTSLPALVSQPLPHMALPTTLSGAEFTSLIGIVDEKTGRKDLYADSTLAPDSIILDPALAGATPWPLWAATGVKLLSDAFEQLCSTRPHPVLEPLLLRSIEWMLEALPRTRERERHAVMKCQLATWMGMFGTLATDNTAGIGASLRHQLGAFVGAPHGALSGVLLPHVLHFSLPTAPAAASSLVVALGISLRPGETPTEAIATAVGGFVAALGLPTTLTELGVTSSSFDEIAANALADLAIRGNRRPIEDPAEIVRMLRSAL
jgi:alcohol dehydrogenase class IV